MSNRTCKNCCFFDVKEVKSVDGIKKLVCICTNEITKDYLTDLNICKYFEEVEE